MPPGEYAVSVWHDDNGNNRFDVDPGTGRPLDGLAPLPAGLRGRPSFEQIRVTVPAASLTLPLVLQYGR